MGRVKKYEFILWIAAAVMVFRVCNSRSGIIGMAAVIGLYLFFSVFNFNYKNFFIKFVFKYSFLWLSIFNFAMIILLPKRIHSVYMLNQMFTGRFALSVSENARPWLPLYQPSAGKRFLVKPIRY